MSTPKTADGYRNNRVGPVLRASPITSAVIEAAEEDNPDKTIRVDDKVAYVRIDCEGEMIQRRETPPPSGDALCPFRDDLLRDAREGQV